MDSKNSSKSKYRTSSTEKKQHVIGKYIIGKTVGSGSMGKVKLGFDILVNEWVAIKIINKSENDFDFFELPNYKNITWKKHMSGDSESNHPVLTSKRLERGSGISTPFSKSEINFLSLVKKSLHSSPTQLQHYSHLDLNQKRKSKKKKDLRVLREVSISQLVIHPHICELKDIIINSDRYFLVSELVVGKQLLEIIVKNGKLNEVVSRHYSRQIASALMYLHKHSIVHRDLKIENIMVNDKNDIKLIDFGLSNLFSAQKQLNTFCGSLYFAAPELLEAKNYYGPEIDCWSFGIVIYVLVCGKVPFDDVSISNLHARIKLGVFELPRHLSEPCKALISSLIVIDPTKRATIAHAISSVWMNIGHSSPPQLYFPSATKVNPPLIHTSQIDESIVQIISKHYSSCYFDGVHNNSYEKVYNEISNLINSNWYKSFLINKYGKYIYQMDQSLSKPITPQKSYNPNTLSISHKNSFPISSFSDQKHISSAKSFSFAKKNNDMNSLSAVKSFISTNDSRNKPLSTPKSLNLFSNSFKSSKFTFIDDQSAKSPHFLKPPVSGNSKLAYTEDSQFVTPKMVDYNYPSAEDFTNSSPLQLNNLELLPFELSQNDSSSLDFEPIDNLKHIIHNFSYLNGTSPILSIYYMVQAKIYYYLKNIENLELSYSGSDSNHYTNSNNAHFNKPLPQKPQKVNNSDVSDKSAIQDATSSNSSVFNQDTFYDSLNEDDDSDSIDSSKPKERKLETFLETLRFLDANPNYFNLSSNPLNSNNIRQNPAISKLASSNLKPKPLSSKITSKIPKVTGRTFNPTSWMIPNQSSKLDQPPSFIRHRDTRPTKSFILPDKKTESSLNSSKLSTIKNKLKKPSDTTEPRDDFKNSRENRGSLLSLFSILNATPSSKDIHAHTYSQQNGEKKKSGWFRSVLKKL
ncbi:Protein kinase kin1 [Smittium culicis]|uniref:Protein kinase kin1 n=1 Tax=Smittium culicis TaxID=133412 RepID=A0A1R1Y500_9FUNG|nr:Protein kinase kin1 [Smittium culicis]